MADVASFLTRFPEFSEEEDDRIQMFLDDAALLMHHPVKWLDFYDVAQLYLSAHYLSVANFSESGDNGVIAPISHQEVDDVVIKQAVSSMSATADELLGTSYGKRFLNYRMIITAGPVGT